MKWMSTFVLAVIVVCFLGNLRAEEGCPWPGQPWACFGLLEIHQEGKAEVFRMIRYSNWEFMAEIDDQSGVKRFLGLRSGTELYFGVEEEHLVPARNPFLMFDQGFALPVAVLREAFPAGPHSIPKGVTEKTVSLDKVDRHFTVPVLITTKRESPDRFQYRLAIAGQVDRLALILTGMWDAKMAAPLADDYSLQGWRHRSSDPIKTLGEARTRK